MEVDGQIAETVLELIGGTPMVRLNRVVQDGAAEVVAKVESHNPAGSVKDRIALSMIEAAEREGRIKPGDTIVEPTSGNTGIGLAMVAAVKGYRLIVTMPEDMSLARRDLLARYGAEGGLTPAIAGMTGAVSAAGVGTGGTIPGVGEVLKAEKPDVLIIAVEPARSPVLQGGRAGITAIQGIGAGFAPGLLNRPGLDQIMSVGDEDAIAMSRRPRREEGLLVGISAGANVVAALKVAKRLGRDKRVVTVLPDTGGRSLPPGG